MKYSCYEMLCIHTWFCGWWRGVTFSGGWRGDIDSGGIAVAAGHPTVVAYTCWQKSLWSDFVDYMFSRASHNSMMHGLSKLYWCPYQWMNCSKTCEYLCLTRSMHGYISKGVLTFFKSEPYQLIKGINCTSPCTLPHVSAGVSENRILPNPIVTRKTVCV